MFASKEKTEKKFTFTTKSHIISFLGAALWGDSHSIIAESRLKRNKLEGT